MDLEGCLRTAEKIGLKAFIPDYIDKVRTYIEHGDIQIWLSLCLKLPSNALAFIETLRELGEIAQLRIFWTAPKIMAKEKRLYTMWTENLVTKDLVDELRAKVGAAQQQQERKLTQIESIMEAYRDRVEQLNAENNGRIEKTMYELVQLFGDV